MNIVEEYVEELNKMTQDLPVIKDLAEKTGLKSGHITLIIGFFILACMIFGFGAHLICDFIGISYPGYMSFKAIESQAKADDKQWLTYWVVFAVWRVMDDWASIFFSWVPLYYPLKLGFLVFLFHPQTQGASVIYEKGLRPFFKLNESRIDAGIKTVQENAQHAAKLAKEEAMKKGSEMMVDHMMQQASE